MFLQRNLQHETRFHFKYYVVHMRERDREILPKAREVESGRNNTSHDPALGRQPCGPAAVDPPDLHHHRPQAVADPLPSPCRRRQLLHRPHRRTTARRHPLLLPHHIRHAHPERRLRHPAVRLRVASRLSSSPQQ